MAYTKKTNKPVVTETVVSPVEAVTPVVETVVEEVKKAMAEQAKES